MTNGMNFRQFVGSSSDFGLQDLSSQTSVYRGGQKLLHHILLGRKTGARFDGKDERISRLGGLRG